MTGQSKSADGQGSPKLKLPKWLTAHFTQALDSLDRLMQITRLSATGIAMHGARPQAIRVLHEIQTDDDQPESKAHVELRRAELDASLAQSEVDQGFPLLHGWAAAALWAWVENFTKGLVAEWLLHRPTTMRNEPFQKIRIRLGEFMALPERERMEYVVDIIDQDNAAPLKRGVGRFAALVQVTGLSLCVSEESRRALVELQAVRNLLAHRNGVVDRRFRQQCPWIKAKLGQPVAVSRGMVQAYANAAAEVHLELLYSVGEFYGQNLRPDKGQERAATSS